MVEVALIHLVVGGVLGVLFEKLRRRWLARKRVRRLVERLKQLDYRQKLSSTSSRTRALWLKRQATGSRKSCRCKTSAKGSTPSQSATRSEPAKSGSPDLFQPNKKLSSPYYGSGVTPPPSSPKNTG